MTKLKSLGSFSVSCKDVLRPKTGSRGSRKKKQDQACLRATSLPTPSLKLALTLTQPLPKPNPGEGRYVARNWARSKKQRKTTNVTFTKCIINPILWGTVDYISLSRSWQSAGLVWDPPVFLFSVLCSPVGVVLSLFAWAHSLCTNAHSWVSKRVQRDFIKLQLGRTSALISWKVANVIKFIF